MKSKDKLVKRLASELQYHINDKEYLKQTSQTLEERFDLPVEDSFDYLTLKNDLETERDNILYCFTVVILGEEAASRYFYDKEIETYKDIKYKKKNLRFPLRFKMIQIGEDQWIGKITAKELMKLRDARLIYYNANVQRTMKHIIRGDIEYYRISLNKKAVDKIEELYNSNNYIPNTITLNMPEKDTIFEYNEETNELIIKNLTNFDIIDGYHRYIAISNLSNLGNFDYNMELRITWFSDERAQQMIWQEDQKTRMSKIDSESFNQNLYSNKIVDYLNLNSDLAGRITRNNGLIDAAQLSNIINGIYFKKLSEKAQREQWIDIRKKLMFQFNELVEENPDLTKKKWSYSFLLATVYSFSKDITNLDEIKKLHFQMMSGDNKALFNNSAYQLLRNQLRRIETFEKG